MIPPKEHPNWIPIIKGEVKTNFNQASANLLLSRLSRTVAKDSSPLVIKTCLDEAYDFFSKFEKTFGDDLKKLF